MNSNCAFQGSGDGQMMPPGPGGGPPIAQPPGGNQGPQWSDVPLGPEAREQRRKEIERQATSQLESAKVCYYMLCFFNVKIFTNTTVQ